MNVTKHHWIRRALMAAVLALPLVATTARADKKTERLWKANCASCHGNEGKGDTEKGVKLKLPDFSSAAWQAKHSDDAELKKTIEKGVSAVRDGVKKEMDPFGDDKLTPVQREALVAYIRGLKK